MVHLIICEVYFISSSFHHGDVLTSFLINLLVTPINLVQTIYTREFFFLCTMTAVDMLVKAWFCSCNADTSNSEQIFLDV